MAAIDVVVISDDHGLGIEACYRKKPNKNKLHITAQAVVFTLTLLLNSCTQATRWSSSVIKVGVVSVGVHISRCLKVELV